MTACISRPFPTVRIVLAAFTLLFSACDRKDEAAAATKPTPVVSQDWPMWGGGPSRNMASTGKNPPVEFPDRKSVV